MISSILLSALVFFYTHQTANATSFPPPSGPYNTTLTTMKLVDYSRDDPFAPTRQPRALMVSVLNPASPSPCSQGLAEYLDPTTAAFEDKRLADFGLPDGLFESITLRVCKPGSNRHQRAQAYPLVLFSPAFGTTRLFYSAIAQQVASAGYTVVTIDHPYDVDIVTYPDNSTVLGRDFPDEQIPFVVATRAKDVSFVLNKLSDDSFARKIIPGLSCGINTSKVGIFGHSVGGATAAEAMLKEKRLAGGINLDGTFFGDVVTKGLKKPFLIFAHEGKNLTTDPSWATIWPKLTGWKRELMLAKSAHYTYTDLASILDVLGFAGQLPAEVTELLGEIDGMRATRVVSSYVIEFFDMVLKGKKGSLFNGPSTKFPEVTFGTSS